MFIHLRLKYDNQNQKTALHELGSRPLNYSGHSFRRGGATFAFHGGAPVELISLQGDWSSETVLLYIAQSLESRLSVAHLTTNKN